LDQLNDRLATKDKQEGAYQDAVRDYQLADQNYRLYLQGVESARVADDLNRQRMTSISVYDKAYASTSPARPRRLLLVALGAIGGLALGIIFAFITEALGEGFSTPAQVSAVLRLPVLGSMGRA
jgi:tyrosine-protein kinase Etk/Wzc